MLKTKLITAAAIAALIAIISLLGLSYSLWQKNQHTATKLQHSENKVTAQAEKIKGLNSRAIAVKKAEQKLNAERARLDQQNDNNQQQLSQGINNDKTANNWGAVPLPDVIRRLRRSTRTDFYRYESTLSNRLPVPTVASGSNNQQ